MGNAYQVSEDDAMDHVFGYVNFIDGSARTAAGGERLLSDEGKGNIFSSGALYRY